MIIRVNNQIIFFSEFSKFNINMYITIKVYEIVIYSKFKYNYSSNFNEQKNYIIRKIKGKFMVKLIYI